MVRPYFCACFNCKGWLICLKIKSLSDCTFKIVSIPLSEIVLKSFSDWGYGPIYIFLSPILLNTKFATKLTSSICKNEFVNK